MSNEVRQAFLLLTVGFCGVFAYVLTGIFYDDLFVLIYNGNKGPIILFIVFMLLELCGCFFISLKLKKMFNKGPKQHGTARLLTMSEAKASKDGVFGDDGVILAKAPGRLTAAKSCEHICLIGPTGSGKSAAIFIPNLLNLDRNSSAVVTDPKGELAEKTAAYLISQGFRVLVLAPERLETMSWNLLYNCKNEEEVIQLSEIIIANGGSSMEQITGTKGGGAEWLSMGANLFKSAMLYEYRQGGKVIAEAVRNLNDKPMEELELMYSKDEYALQYWNVFKQSAKSESTAASIRSTVSNNTAAFLNKNTQRLTDRNQLSASMLREQPTVLFIQYPEEKSAFYAPVFAPLFSQLLSHVKAEKGRHVYFFLDEFANIGRIAGIDNLAATIRSRNMSLTLGIQSISQLEKNYGKSDSTALMENLKTKIFLPGVSGETALYASRLAGTTEMSTLSISSGQKSNTSYSQSTTKRDLVSADEVRRMKDGTSLIVIENMDAIKANQIRYYEDKVMRERSSLHFDNDEYLSKEGKKILPRN